MTKLLASMVLVLGCASAHAEFSMDFIGGEATTQAKMTAGTSQDSPTGAITHGGAFGILFESKSSHFGLETGAIYLKQDVRGTFTASNQQYQATSTLSTLQIPVRARVGPSAFSLGVGAKFNIGLGHVETDISDPNNVAGGNSSTRQTYSAANLRENDVQPDVSVQSKIPFSQHGHILLEVDYEPGTVNIGTSGQNDTKLSVTQFMVGLGFSI